MIGLILLIMAWIGASMLDDYEWRNMRADALYGDG